MTAVKAVVLHSGGLDSTVCLYKAIRHGREVLSLGVDYGQRHRIELDYAASQCSRIGVPRRVIRVEWDKPVRVLPEGRTVEEIRSGGTSPAFLPGRNAIFLVLAAAEAAGTGAAEVWVGVNSRDFSGYPDCRPEFVDAFQRMLDAAIPDGPKVVAPLLSMTKPEIAGEALKLGLTRRDTWSCYRPVYSDAEARPCERCDACQLHAYAWRGFESED
jgi:7-cyano-7-deazaguanine synthase